jgi:hypothetical protein
MPPSCRGPLDEPSCRGPLDEPSCCGSFNDLSWWSPGRTVNRAQVVWSVRNVCALDGGDKEQKICVLLIFLMSYHLIAHTRGHYRPQFAAPAQAD